MECLLLACHVTGLDEEGLYRKPGVLSKATKLVKDCVEKGKLDSLNLRDEVEWDTKTLASAIKGYFNKYLGEPLLTFDLHMQFVDAASEWEREGGREGEKGKDGGNKKGREGGVK